MVTQLRLLSGRARLGSLVRHFSPVGGNNGVCELCHGELDDRAHLLVPRCPRLVDRARGLIKYMKDLFKNSDQCLQILEKVIVDSKDDQELWI